ncbi:DUF1015 domain-containing protein [Methanosarcina sp.]|uniref:DUF1015 domain-containing protein n=1 Tax=Methanosarcina sp. TaxID=2213 RepID=UPI003C70C061
MVLHVPRILLPKDNWEKWAVIACDQHTQDLEYWKRVEEFVGDAPSTFNLIYPEIYLPLDENRVNKIHKTLSDYKKILVDHGPCFVLVRRSISGKERTGLVVAVDLEEYQFNGSDSFIKPTEGTIKERLPARVRIRENAELELSHILVLYDDPDFSVIPRNPDNLVCEDNKVYDFDLMENGGHIKGYRISNEKIIKEISDKILDLGTLLVGDGNHSLAAAKSFWEKIKGTVRADHPARYAMVELVNLHDPGLSFEPIHRVVSGIDPGELLKKFNARIEEVQACPSNIDFSATGHAIGFVTKDSCGILVFDNPEHDLEVETLDEIIDNYSIEYEHDPEVVEKLGKEKGNTGFFLPLFKKNEFFSLIKKKGVLPRKSFSLGKENEKRYYIEAREITP